MKSDSVPHRAALGDKLARLFDDTKYRENLSAVRRSNLNFYALFNVVMLFLLSLLLLSTLLYSYARSMQAVYLLFILCTLLEMILLHARHRLPDRWVMPLCYFGAFKAYLFCLLSSVFFNVDGPAITIYVFLILIPVCFTFRIRVMLLMQCAVTATFCLCTCLLKAPAFILSDCMNCVIFTMIGMIMSVLSTQMRLENFDMYRKTALDEKHNREIFDTTPCGMLELVFDGLTAKVTFANKTIIQMMGYTEEAFWAKKDWDLQNLVFQEDLSIITAVLQHPAVGLENVCDLRLKSEMDGGYHWVSCKSLVTKLEGEQITVLADFLDVDEKKRTESESDAKSRFLSRMSHEIRTPINAIMGMAELERQELATGAPSLALLTNYANETTDASKYLLTLVNDILDTSRIENNKIELNMEVINAEKYLRSVVGLVKPLADAKQITFTCTRETHLRDAYRGDGVRVQQLLLNLLNNAIKFTPDGGTVTLSARAIAETKDTTTLQFSVADNGIGMTEEFQRNLFKPFTQENAGNTSPFSGTGLGLNIARTLAQKMGGDIVCHSKQGEGTTFIATIVVENTDERAPKDDAASPAAEAHWDFTGLRILLCEDHPLNQKITHALLERNGCQVEIAANGAEGVRMMVEHPAGYYAMILMDIRMPVMDGLEATRQIRALDRPDARGIPIVAMSANAFTEDMKKSLAAGMNAHLAKPIDATLLFNTIARFTNRGTSQISRPIVLVVDDIEMNYAIIANILKRDYDVITATDGEQALDKLAHTPGVIAVVTDIQMPNMDGCALIQAIRANYKYDSIAILANTQYGTDGQTEHLLALGADDFVFKPASPTVLANRLRNVIARYRGQSMLPPRHLP